MAAERSAAAAAAGGEVGNTAAAALAEEEEDWGLRTRWDPLLSSASGAVLLQQREGRRQRGFGGAAVYFPQRSEARNFRDCLRRKKKLKRENLAPFPLSRGVLHASLPVPKAEAGPRFGWSLRQEKGTSRRSPACVREERMRKRKTECIGFSSSTSTSDAWKAGPCAPMNCFSVVPLRRSTLSWRALRGLRGGRETEEREARKRARLHLGKDEAQWKK